MATTVNLVTVKVFGEHADYPLAEISETAFGAWARETKVLLRGHAELARNRQILEDAIAPEAKEALWATLPNLADIERVYPDDTWAVTNSPQRIIARTAWQMAWLDRVITACAPGAIVRVLDRLAALTFGDTGKKSGWYSHDDVVQYIAKIKRLENQLGDAFTTAVSEKQKLAVVEKALPDSLRTIMKQSAPPAVDGVVQHDTWQSALVRLGKAIKAVDETRIVTKALRVPKKDGGGGQQRDNRDVKTAIRKRTRQSTRERKDARKKKQANERSTSTANTEKRKLDGECFNCGKKGHKSEDCWFKAADTAGGTSAKGGGRGGQKKGGGRGNTNSRSGGRGGGRGGQKRTTNFINNATEKKSNENPPAEGSTSQ